MWVLNSQPPYFVVLGADGDVMREFGEQGGGPREFDRPVALVGEMGSEAVWTYDCVRNALIRVSAEDRPVIPLPRDTLPVPSLVSFKGAGINAAPPWLEGAEGGFLVARARTTYAESALHLWNVDVLRVSADEVGTTVDLVAPLADHLEEAETRFGAATILMPYPLWTSCADGSMGLYDPLVEVLRRFDDVGDEIGALRPPAASPVAMTPDLVFEMFYRQFAEDCAAGQ